MSDHCAIAWRVAKQRESENQPRKKNKFTGWKASAIDADAMRLCIEGRCAEGSSAEKKVDDVMQKVTSAYDFAISSQLRAKCHKARRLSQRARGKPTFPEVEEKFKLARFKLNKAIKRRKR